MEQKVSIPCFQTLRQLSKDLFQLAEHTFPSILYPYQKANEIR